MLQKPMNELPTNAAGERQRNDSGAVINGGCGAHGIDNAPGKTDYSKLELLSSRSELCANHSEINSPNRQETSNLKNELLSSYSELRASHWEISKPSAAKPSSSILVQIAASTLLSKAL